MTQPQQPELRRSGRGRTSQDGKHMADEADRPEGGRRRRGPVPEENRPGHRPDDEQDKPTSGPGAASEERQTWTCTNCGTEVPATEEVCPNCGAKIPGE